MGLSVLGNIIDCSDKQLNAKEMHNDLHNLKITLFTYLPLCLNDDINCFTCIIPIVLSFNNVLNISYSVTIFYLNSGLNEIFAG